MWPIGFTKVNGNVTEKPGEMLDFQDLLRKRLYDKVIWNEAERAWMRLKREASECTFYTLRKGLEMRLKESFTGCFLQHLNKSENTTPELQQKKLDIAKFLLRINEFPTKYKRTHDYTENIMDLLVDAVSHSKNGIITQKSILKSMASLRLAGSKIGQMDYTLKECHVLEALILTSNYIKEFDAIVLPSNLKLLELYGNLLHDVDLLTKNGPRKLLFLGLGRNYLSTPNSLSQLNKYSFLCYLDLSDNDFECLEDVVSALKSLQSLRSLLLIGSPCSVLSNYREIVALRLPTMELLDGFEIGRTQTIKPTTENESQRTLQIHGFRFFGVPKPKKRIAKKSRLECFYQLEVELPLLDDGLAAHESNVLMHELNGIPLPIIPEEPPLPRVIERPPKRSNQPRVFKPNLGKKGKNKTLDNGAYKLKQQELEVLEAIEDRFYTHLDRDKEIPKAKKFTSPKVQWAPVIKFPSPAISVDVPPSRIKNLRDTFRTVINLRLFYKEESTISKSSHRNFSKVASSKARLKKEKHKTFDVRKVKKDKGNTAEGKDDPNDTRTSKTSQNSVKLVTRNLICKIPIPLQITNWNEDYMGYCWDIKDYCMAKPFPGLKNIHFGSRKKGKQKSSRKQNQPVLDGYIFMTPKLLTAHVGVGLLRTGTNERMRSSITDQTSGKRSTQSDTKNKKKSTRKISVKPK